MRVPSRAVRTAGVATVAVAGPAAMWAAGFQVALGLAAATALAVGAGLSLPHARSVGARAAILFAAVAIMTVSTGLVVGLWLAAGAAYGSWVLEDRPPLPAVPLLPVGARPVALVLLVPGWLLPNDVYRTIPVTLSAALTLVALAGMPMERKRRSMVIVAAMAIHGGVALFVTEDLNALPSLLLLGAASGSLGLGAWASLSDRRWSLSARTGPLAWAAPLLVWWMINVGTWAAGLDGSQSVGYRAWLDGISRYGSNVHEALAATGVPAVLLGLLAIGAHLAVAGRAGLATVARPAAFATAAGTAIGCLWTVQPPLL